MCKDSKMNELSVQLVFLLSVNCVVCGSLVKQHTVGKSIFYIQCNNYISWVKKV